MKMVKKNGPITMGVILVGHLPTPLFLKLLHHLLQVTPQVSPLTMSKVGNYNLIIGSLGF
jgi:hypothetical protein